jgi:hypothetical protein
VLNLKNYYLRGPTENSVVTPDGTKLISNSGNIMQIYSLSDITKPLVVKEFTFAGINTSHNPTNGDFLACNNNCFVVCNFVEGALVVDINTGASKRLTFTSLVNGVAITGNTLILGCSDAIRIYGISTPTSPNLIRTIITNSAGVYTDGNSIAGVDGTNTQKADVYNFSGTLLYTVSAPAEITSVAFIPGHAVVGSNGNTIVTFDTLGNLISSFNTGAADMTKISSLSPSSSNEVIFSVQDFAYVSRFNPLTSTIISRFNLDTLPIHGYYDRHVFVFYHANTAYFVESLEYRGFVIVSIPSMSSVGNTGLTSYVPGHSSIIAAVLSSDATKAYATGDFGLDCANLLTGKDCGSVLELNSRAANNLEYDTVRQLLFIAEFQIGFTIVDVSNPTNLKLLFSNKYHGGTAGSCKLISGNRVIYSSDPGYYDVIDVTKPSAPQVKTSSLVGYTAAYMAVDPTETYIYAAYLNQLLVLKITAAGISFLKTIPVTYTINKISVAGNRLYLTIYTDGVQTYNITDPLNPTLLSTYKPYSTFDALLALDQNTIYLGAFDSGKLAGHVMKLDMKNPLSPRKIDDVEVIDSTMPIMINQYATPPNFDLKGNTLLVNLYDVGIVTYTDTDIAQPQAAAIAGIFAFGLSVGIPLAAIYFLTGKKV